MTGWEAILVLFGGLAAIWGAMMYASVYRGIAKLESKSNSWWSVTPSYLRQMRIAMKIALWGGLLLLAVAATLRLTHP